MQAMLSTLVLGIDGDELVPEPCTALQQVGDVRCRGWRCWSEVLVPAQLRQLHSRIPGLFFGLPCLICIPSTPSLSMLAASCIPVVSTLQLQASGARDVLEVAEGVTWRAELLGPWTDEETCATSMLVTDASILGRFLRLLQCAAQPMLELQPAQLAVAAAADGGQQAAGPGMLSPAQRTAMRGVFKVVAWASGAVVMTAAVEQQASPREELESADQEVGVGLAKPAVVQNSCHKTVLRALMSSWSVLGGCL